MKKNTKNTFSRSFSILAAAALSMTLIGGQTFPVYAGNSSGIESGAVIPDNVTIDSPTALSNIALPSNAYGTLSWVDGSYVPDKRVQSCAVVFKPAADADLSGLPGWDSTSGTLTGSVTVVVSSLDSSSEEGSNGEDTASSEDTGESYDNGTDTPDSSETDTETPAEENGESTDAEQDREEAEPEVTETPADPSESGTDKNTGDNAADVTPEVTEGPEVTETPAEDDNNDSGDQKDKEPAATETPEKSKTPEATETPEVTELPKATEAPAEDEKNSDTAEKPDKKEDSADSEDKDSKEEEITESPEDKDNEDNIFDREDDLEDKRPQNAATDLTETEMEAIAAQNHTCDGITVSGIDLPWYVQFRVSGGDDYQFTNEEDAAIFKSYEFELWDTRNNTEYKIPDGEYISVTVPVKAGYTYSIEHLLDNGAMETIIPSVDGDTMTFSTHSFSPFGIAGSKSLVGPDAEDSSADVTTAPAADSSSDSETGSTDNKSTDTGSVDTSNSEDNESTDSADSAESDSTGSADSDTSTDLTTGTADLEDSSSQNDSSAEDQSSETTSKKQVNTGDTTQILPFVILFVAAAVVAGAAVFFKRRKK